MRAQTPCHLIDEQSEWEASRAPPHGRARATTPTRWDRTTARTARRGSSSTTSTASTRCTARATRPTARPRRCAALPAGTLVTGRTMARHTRSARVLRLRLPHHVLGRTPPLLLPLAAAALASATQSTPAAAATLAATAEPTSDAAVHRRHPARRISEPPAVPPPSNDAAVALEPTDRTRGTWHRSARWSATTARWRRSQCEAVLFPGAGGGQDARRRSMQTGQQRAPSCAHAWWGIVPVGCSVQSGGDWTAHYKTSGSVCTTHARTRTTVTRVLHHTSQSATKCRRHPSPPPTPAAAESAAARPAAADSAAAVATAAHPHHLRRPPAPPARRRRPTAYRASGGIGRRTEQGTDACQAVCRCATRTSRVRIRRACRRRPRKRT